ncbi:MAG: OmpA family protein [Pseudomonadota bacterium]
MRPTPVLLMCLLAAPVFAQDQTAEDPVDEVMQQVTDDIGTTASDVMEDLAASEPALDLRVGEDGQVDAMVMLSDVLFSFGDASLRPTTLDVLRVVAEQLNGIPAIEITGHTDSIGSEAYNIALGQRRADAVRDWLIANTPLTADVVTARGVGESDPIAPNLTENGADNPAGRALNRRVEFAIPGQL